MCQSAEFQTKYFGAKDLLKSGKYKEAMEMFLPLTSEAEGNAFS
jgi:TolA-binding protein